MKSRGRVLINRMSQNRFGGLVKSVIGLCYLRLAQTKLAPEKEETLINNCITPRRVTPIVAALLASLCLSSAWADDAPAATPYRPTVSNPAELSAPGWLEVEAGLARTKGGDSAWQNDTPWLLKLAFTEDFGVLLGGDARVRQTDASGAVLSGFGDTSLTFKNHWAVDESSAFGVEWGAKFPTAATNIGSGKQDYGVNGIYSRDIGSVRIDANIGATRLGLHEVGLAQWQYSWAVAISRPLNDDWSIELETSGASRHGGPPSTQLLLATSYSVTKRLVLDCGVVSGTSEAAPKWSAFMGATYLAARFW